ncbi:MAG: amidohydrolase family protein [Candidatus Latescibacteria bacterium]|jgi:N-acetylglucosamine-6-phosphate deacetylase|nr:amidohydrolase family protein [Candidatus Latescibacterota bacterium]
MEVRGRIVGTTEPVTLVIRDCRIETIGDSAAPEGTLGGDDVWIAPAFFDVQVNGALGINYSRGDLTVARVLETTELIYKTGTGLLCPTVTTSPEDEAVSALRTLGEACEESKVTDASFVGFHVEGPYISSEDGPRGAHPAEHVRDPDWDEFCRYQEAAGGRIRILTLAPEREGAMPFIEKAVDSGVIVSIGHSGASQQRVHEAIAAGVRMSTHLGNGSHAMIPRHDNYVWDQLASDELWAGVIPDGHHLPPPFLKIIYRAKQKERICLTSDVSAIAGLPAGVYDRSYGEDKVEIHPNGKISLAGTPYLAGASLFLDTGIANVATYTGASLTDAVEMATANPARMLDVADRVGSVDPGKEASLTLFRWEPGVAAVEVVATIVRGETVYQAG